MLAAMMLLSSTSVTCKLPETCWNSFKCYQHCIVQSDGQMPMANLSNMHALTWAAQEARLIGADWGCLWG